MNRLNRVLAGTLVLPTVFGVLVLWSLSDRAEQSDQVPAAVVNLDRPVTTGTGGHRQVVYAGRLLAAGLTSPRHRTDNGLGWQLTDRTDAQQGLRDGDYYAVVTIPRGFSRTLSGIGGADPARAGITVQSNDSSSALVGEASRQVTDLAAARLGRRITSTYLAGVYRQTGRLRGRLGSAADGAGRLADGTGRLRSGAQRLGRGAGTLAGGLGTMSHGADRLSAGATRLADGAARLHHGADRLAAGSRRLDAGAARLAGGLGRLSAGTDGLPGRTRALAHGAHRVSAGVGPYARLVKGWERACLADPVVAAAQPKLCAGTVQAAGPTGSNADRLAAGARRVAAGAGRLAAATPRLKHGIDRSARGAAGVAGGTHRLAAGTQRLARGSGRVATGAGRLGGGAHDLAAGAGRASAGAQRLADGSSTIADGTSRLAGGSRRLATGLRHGAHALPAADAPHHQAQVLADPVTATATDLNPAHDGATLLAPAVLAFGLWLGAFVTYLVRQALPDRWLRAAGPGWRVALAGWLPAVGIGVVQAVLLFAAVAVSPAGLASPVAVAGFMVVAAAVFAALNQAFVAAAGPRRGWILSIAFAVLQAVSLGGLVPITTAPGPLQWLNAVLPVSRAADGFGHLVLGGRVGSPAADLLVLALWGAGALAVTAVAARRRQRTSLADVRRQVAPAA
ncbi:MAG: YhgE/Pip family protein [Nocardioidaceae bacterium]